MHRPGICEVYGETVSLNGTTLEEVERAHKATLLLALEETNRKYAEYAAQKAVEQERSRNQEQEHRRTVAEGVKRIKFD